MRNNCIKILNYYTHGGNNEIIKKLKEKNNNKKCYILGNGPSLNNINLQLLNNEMTIACNGFFNGLVEKKTKFIPTILCAGDRHYTKYFLDKDFNMIYNNGNTPIIIMHPSFSSTYSISKINKYNFKKYHYIYNIYNFSKFKLTKSFLSKKQINYNIKNYCKYYSNVIPMISMLIAQKLGFKKIYLIGVDCNNVFNHFYTKKTHVSKYYPSKSYNNIYNGFKKRYFEFKYQNIEVYIHNKNSLINFIPHFNF